MTSHQEAVATIAVVLGLLVSCAPKNGGAELDPPPESTYSVMTARFEHEDRVTEVQAARVTREFFALLDRDPWLGRLFVPEELEGGAERVVVLSHELWRDRLGGSPDVLGGTVRVAGRDHTVVGVMPPGIVWPRGVELWVPRRNEP